MVGSQSHILKSVLLGLPHPLIDPTLSPERRRKTPSQVSSWELRAPPLSLLIASCLPQHHLLASSEPFSLPQSCLYPSRKGMGEHGVPKTTLCSAMGIRGLSLRPRGPQECAWDT